MRAPALAVEASHSPTFTAVAVPGALLALGTVVSRVPFLATSTALDQDAAHFALALEHFDLLHKQPHPPGYLLFLAPAALLHQLGLAPLPALVWTSVAFGVAGVLATWSLGRLLFGPTAGLIGASLLSASPLFWSRGELGLSYTAEATCQALVGCALWQALARVSANNSSDRLRLSSRASGGLALASVALGLAAGVRQDLLLFIGPVWLWIARLARPRTVVVALLFLAGAVLLWAIPLLALSGGVGTYLEATRSEAAVVGPQMGLDSAANLRSSLRTVVVGLAWLGGASWLVAAAWLLGRARIRSATSLLTDRRVAFLAIWTIPPLLFFVLIHAKLDYLLSVGPPIAVMLGAALVHLSADGRRRGVAVAALISANALLFLLWPAGGDDWLGRRDILAADRVVTAYSSELISHFDPRAAVVITPAGSTPGFRAAMLDFPAYAVFRLDVEAPGPAEYVFARDHASTYPLPSGGSVIQLDSTIQVLAWLADDPQPPPDTGATPAQAHASGVDVAYYVIPFPASTSSLRVGPYQFVHSRS